jgi:hypothetical protein
MYLNFFSYSRQSEYDTPIRLNLNRSGENPNSRIENLRKIILCQSEEITNLK